MLAQKPPVAVDDVPALARAAGDELDDPGNEEERGHWCAFQKVGSPSAADTNAGDALATNGKAEALIKTLLRNGPTASSPTSAYRARALPGYLRRYSHHRPQPGGRPPISHVSQVRGSHS